MKKKKLMKCVKIVKKITENDKKMKINECLNNHVKIRFFKNAKTQK